jgi:hypothetical protein
VSSSEIIFEVEESREGGYEARALGHPIFTEAEGMEELKVALRDAVRCHFDDAERPRIVRFQGGPRPNHEPIFLDIRY